MADSYARVAIVTGASSGIGEATARKFVSSGFGVVGLARNAKKLAALEQELGSGFRGVAGDATDNTVLDALFATADRDFGKAADIVVANAGSGLKGSVKDADLTQFEEMFRVNVSATLALLQKAARRMFETQQHAFPKAAADIVIIGSVAGRNISAFSAVYGSTKFAVRGLAEGLRREVATKGVRVTLIEPGIVRTGFQAAADYSDEMVQGFEDKFGPLLSAEDVANSVHYVVTQPPHVHVSDIMIRPTRQDYP